MTTPYLQQHAHQPVQWYAWDEETLQKVRDLDRPILLSIGYSTCHWCHVMARESFDDEVIAEYMNAHFVNIKVDREERPDLDQLYMEACQLMTGKAGWPLNIFLTPDQRPFFAGTYFPPEPGFRQQSWYQALQYAAYNFYENRSAVERQATRVMEQLQQATTKRTPSNLHEIEAGDQAILHKVFEQLAARFDETAGGFGQQAKYPNFSGLELLLHLAFYTKNERANQHLQFTVDQMLAGGIYDHLGGGLARYTVDRNWHIPHFEKMLYDNALLVSLLSDLYRWTKVPKYKKAIRKTLDFIERELTSAQSGFYAALDADIEGQEGAYYTWSKAEIVQVLGADAKWFCEFYSITLEGNWEGKNILWHAQTKDDFIKRKNWSLEDFEQKLTIAEETLFRHRQQRPRPHRDEKVILSWNALQATAYAKAYMALGVAEDKEKAIQSLEYLIEQFGQVNSSFYRIAYQGEVSQPAFLQDYAFLIEALLTVYQITFSLPYLHRAADLTDEVLNQFYDPNTGLFFFESQLDQKRVFNAHDLVDAEVPGGSAVMFGNLQKLGLLLDRTDYRKVVQKGLAASLSNLRQSPLAHAKLGLILIGELFGLTEIAVLGPDAKDKAQAVNKHFLGSHVLMASTKATEDYPLLAHRWQANKTLIYLCQDFSCQRPVETVEELLQLFKANQK